MRKTLSITQRQHNGSLEIVASDTTQSGGVGAATTPTFETTRQPQQLLPQKIDGRFHLPVLNLNSPEHWQSLPLDQRRHFTDDTATKTCLTKCCGYDGLSAGCCKVDPTDLEHVLGVVDEPWIKSTVRWLRSNGFPNATRSDVVIDREEGMAMGERLFNSHPAFEAHNSYPMLRLQVNGPGYACKFLSLSTGKCTIYERRPFMCKSFLCQYIKTSFLVRTIEKPNTWTKLR